MKKQCFLIFYVLIVVSACKTEVKTTSSCGDNFLDPGEECDGSQFIAGTCQELGFYQGTPACAAGCVITGCSGICGDGVLHLVAQEECDGSALNGATCASLGQGGGTLACDSFCHFDTSGCSCGNGTLDAEEDCDGAQLGGQTCISLGYAGGVLACGSDCRFQVTSCTTLCGNGAIELGEQCDDGDVQAGDGCSNLCQTEAGWQCDGQPSTCSEICGDNVLAGDEICDGDQLNGLTCEDFAFYGGTLMCTNQCTISSELCQGRCGDGQLDAAEGEVCDLSDFGAHTCQTEGFYRGSLTCASTCDRIHTDLCSGTCGDNTTDYTDGEVCDGTDLGGLDCSDFQFYQGTLGCEAGCGGFSTAGCSLFCGDGLIQTLFGEQCDGAALGAGSCASHFQPGGTLSCNACAWNESTCNHWTQVSGGYGHACALRSDGAVYCWGDNGSGEVGDGFTTRRTTPVPTLNLSSGVVQIIAGRNHSCARTTTGAVYCWGSNASGQLGDGTTINHLTPTLITGQTFSFIASGANADHTCGITSAGALRCWGANSQGQLGDNSITSRSSPVNVSGATSGVTHVSCGALHTCMVKAGAVWCWGYNSTGQLGDGTTSAQLVPVATSLTTGYVQVAAGEAHSCARSSSGAARCWGDNSSYQIGDGTSTRRTTPTAVSGLSSGVTWITTGSYHTCALKSDGTTACWGWNNRGQCGTGGCSGTLYTPYDIPALTGALDLTSGHQFNCVRLDSGRLSCWGDNTDGQMARGTSGITCTGSPDYVLGF